MNNFIAYQGVTYIRGLVVHELHSLVMPGNQEFRLASLVDDGMVVPKIDTVLQRLTVI